MENFVTEEQFQAACMTWYRNTFRNEYRMCFAVDNNPSPRLPPNLRIVEGNRKMSIGVRDGVFDAFYIGYGFIAIIDFKLIGRRLSKPQSDFANQCKERGHDLAYTVEPDEDGGITNFITLIQWLRNHRVQYNTGK